VPPGVRSDRLLLVTRTESLPALQSVAGLALIYESEAGYVRMARPLGRRRAHIVTWLEVVDRWTVSQWKRRVYEVRLEGDAFTTPIAIAIRNSY
jgi:hypothetical protein